MVQFKDKTLLITGGGTGIGEAIAYQFAQRGRRTLRPSTPWSNMWTASA